MLHLIYIITILTISLSLNCNISHFDFVSRYSLGKQDELNRTFTKMQSIITTLPNVTFSNNNSIYTIYNTNTTFIYRDSMQRAVVTGNTIVIDGGIL